MIIFFIIIYHIFILYDESIMILKAIYNILILVILFNMQIILHVVYIVIVSGLLKIKSLVLGFLINFN